ncbi:hypothetical protein CYMTET_53257 [Cymbomonas tetramitiformis]|uniref:Uncharacterized protein n=1 Tax=Cymbomonas tetramitiformis TaxID=36881 RepID=A0AAE0BHE5_9CHLO|nr:hypothetical protein CYMTET_53257 [Cymbomonas tetramitiformis]
MRFPDLEDSASETIYLIPYDLPQHLREGTLYRINMGRISMLLIFAALCILLAFVPATFAEDETPSSDATNFLDKAETTKTEETKEEDALEAIESGEEKAEEAELTKSGKSAELEMMSGASFNSVLISVAVPALLNALWT